MRLSPRSPSVGGIPRTSWILDQNSPPPTTTSTGTSSPIRPPFLPCDQQPPPHLQNRKSVTPSPLKDNDPLPTRCPMRSTPPLQTAEGKEAAHDSSMPLSIDRSQMKPSPINHRQTKRRGPLNLQEASPRKALGLPWDPEKIFILRCRRRRHS